MRYLILPLIIGSALCLSLQASAEETGAPAAASGAPASAAQHGSSMAGDAASKNEMSSHNDNAAKQAKQADPHKQAH